MPRRHASRLGAQLVRGLRMEREHDDERGAAKADPESSSGSAQLVGEQMSARKRFLFLALIMVGACAMVMTAILYRHEVPQQREMLQVTAQSQARLIEVQGGRIWVESEGSGQGSTFCFALPTRADVG